MKAVDQAKHQPIEQLSIAQLVAIEAAACKAIRDVLSAAGALEARTPILSPHPDLAPLRQFVTVHPTTGQEYCLRIAPEEHLTRLLALGVPAAFEIATNFRDEIPDDTHLIEFTSVEALYRDRTVVEMRDLVSTMCAAVESAVRSEIVSLAGRPALFARRVENISLPAWVENTFGFERDLFFDTNRLPELHKELCGALPIPEHQEQLVDNVMTAVAAMHGHPVFISDIPEYVGGPAEPCSDDNRFVQRSELFVGELELGCVETQTADMTRIQKHWQRNVRLKTQLDIRPNRTNDRLLSDFAAGLPDLYAGLGIGLDRLIMVVLGIDDLSLSRRSFYGETHQE